MSETKLRMVSFEVSADDWAALRFLAAGRDQSRSAVLRSLISEALRPAAAAPSKSKRPRRPAK
jgi:hypothetical protein